jgi:hypothetical protein
VSCDVGASRWSGDLRVPLRDVASIAGSGPWRALAAAVLGGGRGPRTYLTSAMLPGEQANFHQPERWPIVP